MASLFSSISNAWEGLEDVLTKVIETVDGGVGSDGKREDGSEEGWRDDTPPSGISPSKTTPPPTLTSPAPPPPTDGSATAASLSDAIAHDFASLKDFLAAQLTKEKEMFEEEERETQSLSSSSSKKPVSPPWENLPLSNPIKLRECMQEILSLGKNPGTILNVPPENGDFPFNLQSVAHQAQAAMKDPHLSLLRYDLVPKQMSEEDFWRSYFYRVDIIKASYGLSSTSLSSSLTPSAEPSPSPPPNDSLSSQSSPSPETTTSSEAPPFSQQSSSTQTTQASPSQQLNPSPSLSDSTSSQQSTSSPDSDSHAPEPRSTEAISVTPSPLPSPSPSPSPSPTLSPSLSLSSSHSRFPTSPTDISSVSTTLSTIDSTSGSVSSSPALYSPGDPPVAIDTGILTFASDDWDYPETPEDNTDWADAVANELKVEEEADLQFEISSQIDDWTQF